MKVKGWFGALSVVVAILLGLAVASIAWDAFKRVKESPLNKALGGQEQKNTK